MTLWAVPIQAPATFGYFEPTWTLILYDVRINLPVGSLLDYSEYKRYYTRL